MVFPVTGGTQDTGYDVSNSLRFNDGDSPRLSREFAQDPTSRTTFTFSAWVKKTSNSHSGTLMSAQTTSNFRSRIYFDNDTFRIQNHASGSQEVLSRITHVLRDPSAWYHLVWAIDTTQADGNNGMKLYINGVQQSISINPYAQNATFEFARNGTTTTIGRDDEGSYNHFDGYMSEVNYIDGQQLTPSNFGKTNDNGVWVPIEYTGTYGNNGFFLEFKQTGTSANSSGMGADTSGNDEHFTPTNLAAIDVTTDTPTNNFCTLNPLIGGAVYTPPSYSEGNCKWSSSSSGSFGSSGIGTIAPNSGKWYWESKITSSIVNGVGSGARVMEGYNPNFNNDSFFAGNTSQSGGVGYSMNYNNGKPQTNSAETTTNQGNAVSQNDIVGIAMDLDNGAIYYSINGTFQASGDPTSGSSKTNAQHSFTVDGSYAPAVYGYQSSVFEMNFGNAPFSISSGNSDANGYGNFEYAVPSGYYSINTKNLAEFG